MPSTTPLFTQSRSPVAPAVHESGRHLVRGDEFFPLIIDTAWSAFADASEDEWRIYLAARRRQGFTAVLVTALPVLHDRVARPEALEPFALDPDGHHDFSRINPRYFARAREYTRIAHDEFGILLMITVLWNNYLPGTWGAAATPEAVMPATARRAFVEEVADAFLGLAPVFVVGGDDHYDIEAANEGYLEAIGILRERAPESLLTTHTAPHAVLPDSVADGLDFFLHQSGHNVENTELTWRQPAQYLARSPRKPLVNSEPPYELHGKVGGKARWTRDEVRAAGWVSILAGSTAGIGYGAHGVWMWGTTRGDFQASGPSLDPFTWVEALTLPGALDVSLIAKLFRDHRLDRLDPAQELVPAHLDPEFRAAASSDGDLIAIYLPYALTVPVACDLRRYRLSAWDLQARAPLIPDVRFEDGATTLSQLFSSSDQLVIAERIRL